MTMTHVTDSTAAERAAVEWEVLLREGALTPEHAKAFDAWLSIDAHRDAWSTLQARLGSMRAFANGRESQIAATLRTPSQARRRWIKASLGATAFAAVGLGSLRLVRELGLDADWRSSIGEQRRLTLGNGTQLWLDAQTRIYDVTGSSERTASTQARWQLGAGQLLVRGRGAIAVETPHGVIATQDAVFNVARFPGYSALSLESGLAVVRPYDRPAIEVAAGDTVHFSDRLAHRPDLSFDAATAWTRRLVIADQMTLRDLLDSLSRYDHRVTRALGATAQLRISGVFRLGSIDEAIAQVASVLPVTVTHIGPYLTLLS